MKKGEYFEQLINWINENLHKNSTITPNDYLIDKVTGRKRQIDISIRLKDGPTDFLAIVEVRDRSRPVGIEYIEQIKSKRDSVNANLAIVVSKNGFFATAIKKADNYGIKLYTAEEALKQNWSKSISQSIMTVFQSVTGKAELYILNKDTKEIIEPCQEIVNSSGNELVFMDKNNKPFKSLKELFGIATSSKELWSKLKVGEQNKIFQKIFCSFDLDYEIFFFDKKNVFQKIELVCLIGEFWIEEKRVSPKVLQYKDKEKVLAEVLKFDMSNDGYLEVLTKNPNETNKNREMIIRFQKKP
jgi:hypothetical protein